MSLTKVTYSMISGAPINVMDYIPQAEHAAIYNYTSTYDSGQAIQNAFDDASAKEGGTVILPAGLFNTSQTIDIHSYLNIQGEYGEDGSFGVQTFRRGTQIKWIGANVAVPVLRAFNARLFQISGFNIDGDNKNVAGFLLDSDNTPSGSQNEISRFSIRRCLLGVEWGTGGVARPFANDGTRFSTFTVWSQMSNSVGFRINSGNAGQMSTIESGGVQVDSIGIDLICANLLQIRRVFGGGQMRSSFIRAQLPLDVLIEGSSSEAQGDRTDGRNSTVAKFLLVIPSVEQPAFALRDFTMTLMNNQCNNPILIQSPIRIVSVGDNFGYAFTPGNVAVPTTADTVVGGNGSFVSVINSGTQTYAPGFPFPSGWQPSQYVNLTNLKPENTSLFWGTQSAIFPVNITSNNRALTLKVTNASGGVIAAFNDSSGASGQIISGGGIASYFTTLTVFWTSGNGSPEGSIAAPVGSLWTRLDGGAGTSLYVKESGTGNTGWAAK